MPYSSVLARTPANRYEHAILTTETYCRLGSWAPSGLMRSPLRVPAVNLDRSLSLLTAETRRGTVFDNRFCLLPPTAYSATPQNLRKYNPGKPERPEMEHKP